MALSALPGVFFCWSSCMEPFLLGMHKHILLNCQAHSGQHRKFGVNWNVTGFTFQKQRTGKQGVSMAVCKWGVENQKYNEKVELNRASQPFPRKETMYQNKVIILRYQNTDLLTLKSYLELSFQPQSYDWGNLLPAITQSDNLMIPTDSWIPE